jgi:hypothetical protein
MSLERIDHSLLAEGRVTTDLSKENYLKLVKVFTEQIQEVEDEFLTLGTQKNIDTSEGVWLDYIGKILGVLRGGRNDEEYKRLLKVTVASNNISGTPNQIISTIKQYTNADFTRIVEHPLAHGRLYTNGDSNLDYTLLDLIDNIKPTGTSWIISADEDDNALYLAWVTSSYETVEVVAFAEAGEPLMEADATEAEAGASFNSTVQQLVKTLYQPSLNGQNTLPYRTNITTFNVQCGESLLQCGESQAQLGNTESSTPGLEFARPLYWRVTTDSLIR